MRINTFRYRSNDKRRTMREIFGWRVEMDFRKEEDERLIRGGGEERYSNGFTICSQRSIQPFSIKS